MVWRRKGVEGELKEWEMEGGRVKGVLYRGKREEGRVRGEEEEGGGRVRVNRGSHGMCR